jgi:flagellar basal body-associated protein FliL
MDFQDKTTKTETMSGMISMQINVIRGKISALARKKIFWAVIIAAVALGMLLPGWFLIHGRVKQKEKLKIYSAEKSFAEYSISPFFLPISTRDGGERMVRIQFSVQLAPGSDEEIKKNLTLLRSMLYKRLQSKGAEDLRNWEKISALKREIQEILNQKLTDRKVDKVLVTELLVF